MSLPWPIREARLARIATRARKGDRAAVVWFHRALHPDVSRFVGRRVASLAEAENAVAATFHRLLEHGSARKENTMDTVLFRDGAR